MCIIMDEAVDVYYVVVFVSVVALSSPQYKVGDTVTMKLMVREKVSLFYFPSESVCASVN